MTLEYLCPKCYMEMSGSFGEPVVCPKCSTEYETDWDYTANEDIVCWIVGLEEEDES